jgi:hypothetical protein
VGSSNSRRYSQEIFLQSKNKENNRTLEEKECARHLRRRRVTVKTFWALENVE